ncbi:MAG TPA: hypothetical protein VJG65_02930 [Patescibacteria group bacterium]|nr:hypothetical protein [Patescibacteria group bacterium]
MKKLILAKLTSIGLTTAGADHSKKHRPRQKKHPKRKKQPNTLQWWLRTHGFGV